MFGSAGGAALARCAVTKPDFWSRIHLALVQDDDPRVLVVLLLGSVFGIYARPLDLEHKQETGNRSVTQTSGRFCSGSLTRFISVTRRQHGSV